VVRSGYLVPATGLFCAGTLLHGWLPSPVTGTLALGLLLAGGWLSLARRRSAALWLMAALLLAGAVRGRLHADQRRATASWLAALDGAGAIVELRGRVYASDGGDALEATGRRLAFEFRRAHVRVDGGWRRLDEPVRAFLYGYGAGQPRPGEMWMIQGRLRVRDGAGVRFRGWPRLVVSGEREAACRVLTAFDWLDMPALLAARAGMAALLRRGIEDAPVANAVIGAMVLGYRTALPPETRALFRRTGTAHVFAISGLHVGILCALLVGLMRYLQVPRMLWVLPLTPLITGYAFLTGARPSALRACLMAVCYFAAPLVGRRPRVATALAAAALLIVGFDPGQLRDPGFIFSFVVVGGIVALMPLLERVTRGWVGPDPLLPPELEDEGAGWGAWRRRAARYGLGLAGISVAAWLVSAPLMAYYFNRFAPVALVANMLAVPLAFLIILTSVLSIVAGSCIAMLGEVLNHTNLLLVGVQTGLARLLGALPGASFHVPSPPLALLILYYGLLLVVALGLRERGGCAGCDDAG